MVAATTVFEKCPAGYEVVNSDYIVNDGYVYVSVKKAEVKSAKVNYYDESAKSRLQRLRWKPTRAATMSWLQLPRFLRSALLATKS
ncbi:hypothetical protein NIA69_23270 [Gemmiger formicilis]|nr:hypothetical protein [Gemmiger formicilis]MCO7111476.1 hypothetical protein [Gemmiger formicilis]